MGIHINPFGTGPVPSRIMIVGDCISSNQHLLDDLLNKILHDAGIMRTECYTTNLLNDNIPYDDIEKFIHAKKTKIPPTYVRFHEKYCDPRLVAGYERLQREIQLVSPTIIITLGNTAFWSLTTASGILKWRGSLLTGSKAKPWPYTVLPTHHPRSILSQYELRPLAVRDLSRARDVAKGVSPKPPVWNFIVRPSYATVTSTLGGLLDRLNSSSDHLWIDLDYETRAGHIACVGLSWSLLDCLCIPFMCVENRDGYWSLGEETIIVHTLYKILCHPRCKIRWQNGLYDAQYCYRHWHFVPNGCQDTMISHHTCFPGLQKSLAFQASMYCSHYVYWKDDGKTWSKDIGEDQLWEYNCQDCVRTREVGEVAAENILSMGLQAPEAFQQRLFYPVLRAMQLGVRIDLEKRAAFARELQSEMDKRSGYFTSVLGHPLNPRSSSQMQKLFYGDFAQPEIKTRAKKGIPGHVSCDDEALSKISKREPLLLPLTRRIQEYRTLGVFKSTFVDATLDVDNRMRCSYNICGTETFRLSSAENAFGSGTNLQNIPSGNEDETDPTVLRLPNVRRIFVPDPGYTFFDIDLDRADLQVVVWEADEPELKLALAKGVDMHLLNAFALLGKDVDLDHLIEGTEEHRRLKHDYAKERKLSKAFIHGTNYGGKERTMAVTAGITVHQASRFQSAYFSKYPGIKKWHTRTEALLKEKRYVENKFGYRRHYFGSLDGLLPEALAWVPQSTVACVINRAWVNIHDNLPAVQVLLQVHDSLAGQFPTHNTDLHITNILRESRIVIPYSHPLIIPVGIKTSPVSWGDCKGLS